MVHSTIVVLACRLEEDVLGLVVVVVLGTTVLVGTTLGGRYRVAPPALLIVLGVGLGLLPGLSDIELDPDWVLLLFLPAILHRETLTTSLREIRANLRVIALSGIALVIATTATVSYAAQALGVDSRAAWVLGAVLAPTDQADVQCATDSIGTSTEDFERGDHVERVEPARSGRASTSFRRSVGPTVGPLNHCGEWRISRLATQSRHCRYGRLGHTVAVLAVDGVIAFDLATPIEVFGRTVDARGDRAYDVLVAGPRRTAAAGPTTLAVPHGLDRLVGADTVVVPGRADPTVPLDGRAVRALQDAAVRGARIATICVGALDLAATGLLDGLRATTHWKAAGLLAARHPAVVVDAAALFVDNGQILCSAGAAAGLDLCLHMIARDHGGAVAAEAARIAVVPLTRDANQAQYIRDDDLGSTGLAATLTWIDEHARQPVTVGDIARTAAVSTRTLNRHFADELGTIPRAWLTRARVRCAQQLLETTNWPIDRIATESGLGSATNLRARFGAIVGTSPTRYRTALGSRSSAAPTNRGTATSAVRPATA